jgi:uncharacterized protein (TIGR03084 family)
MQQADDFLEESQTLYRLLAPLGDKNFQKVTQFKDWTISDVIGHLHMWNWAADLSLNDPTAFQTLLDSVAEKLIAGGTFREAEAEWLDGLENTELLQEWHLFFTAMADRFKKSDPQKRVKWAGPDLSVKTSITGRLMETWAHGQEIYDVLGVKRKANDRIKNIAQLGVITFGWTFSNRQMDIPLNKPFVKLTAPSGKIWEWNDPSDDNRVEGSAEEFCQVVTQTRHFSDTSLSVIGETANSWLSLAQCFAGPPSDPPEAGSRSISPLPASPETPTDA